VKVEEKPLVWTRPVHREDPHWTAKHRSQHWMTTPLPPINIGIVRQKYREIGKEYDRGMIIHPAFFGFNTRMRGAVQTESRFIHPLFFGFQLPKKVLSESQLEKMRLEAMKKKKGSDNPYRYDPNAAALGKCPVCADGRPGCPRCFMMPKKNTGEPYIPSDFELNIEVFFINIYIIVIVIIIIVISIIISYD
jgi:hypothetical protein